MWPYIKNKLAALIALLLIASFAGGALAVWIIINLDLLGVRQFFNTNEFSNRPVTIVSPQQVNLDFDVLVGNMSEDVGKRLANIYFKKSPAATGFNSLYTADEVVGRAVAVTNDGWFLTTYRPTTGREVVHIPILNGGRIYDIDQVVTDPHSGIVFFKVALDAEMPVVNFSNAVDWKIGQTVIGWLGKDEAVLGAIKRVQAPFNRSSLVFSSETVVKDLAVTFNGPSGQNLVDMQVYDLSGRLMAIADKKGKLVYINWPQAVLSLLKKQAIARPYLGVSYMPVDKFIGGSAFLGKADVHTGVLIKGLPGKSAVDLKSPARAAGIKEGDIIVAVENDAIDANHTLDSLIQEYQPGDIIKMTLIDSVSGQKREVVVTLGEF